MKQQQQVCAGCGTAYWPNQAWQHKQCRADSDEPVKAESANIGPVDAPPVKRRVASKPANTANGEPANSANTSPVANAIPANSANSGPKPDGDIVDTSPPELDDVHAALSDAIAKLGERTVIGLLKRAVSTSDRNAYQRELMKKRRADAKGKTRL